jgi:putative transposase
LLAFKDVFSKEIVGYHLGLNCKAVHLGITLEEALIARGLDPLDNALVVRSDNGPQMTSHQFRKYVEDLGVDHEFTPLSCPNKNSYIESFFSIFETQFLQVRYFEDFRDAYEQSIEFINFYHEERLHGSLGYLPPKEFMEKMALHELEPTTLSV